MATRTLGPGSLKIGETASVREFAAHLTNCELKSDTSSDDPTPMLDGSNMDGEDTYAWSLAGKIQQNYDFDSLEKYCFTNRGELLPFVFTPANDGGIDWSGILKVRPVASVGGDVKKRNTTDFEFQIIGDPTPGEVV